MDNKELSTGTGLNVDPEPGRKSQSDHVEDHKADLKELGDEETDHQARLGYDLQRTETEIASDKKFLRKIDWHIMPLLMFTYGLQVIYHTLRVYFNQFQLLIAFLAQYSDKITLSSAVAFDLKKNTHLVGNDFAWLSTGL